MLNRHSLEILLDLLEIKISTIMVQNKDDLREVKKLKACRKEIHMLLKQSIENRRVEATQIEINMPM